jgi:hypothetical protein
MDETKASAEQEEYKKYLITKNSLHKVALNI